MKEVKTFDKGYTYGDFDMQVEKKEELKKVVPVLTNDARAIAEVQAQYIIAKKFPRNQHDCYRQIIDACKNIQLAEKATYLFPKGGTSVKGPSIRLAEAVAQLWGNMDCGVRELSQENGVSIAESYAVDLQTNTRVTKTFHVPHIRETKNSRKMLTDPRDIYELVANYGARRLRACILAVIPAEIMKAALEQCEQTLLSNDIPLSQQIKRMIIAFDELGVKPVHIEQRLGHSLDSATREQVVELKGIYRAIRDGITARDEYFNIATAQSPKDEIAELLE